MNVFRCVEEVVASATNTIELPLLWMDCTACNVFRPQKASNLRRKISQGGRSCVQRHTDRKHRHHNDGAQKKVWHRPSGGVVCGIYIFIGF